MKSTDIFHVDLDATYSFSVNTSNLDLPSWSIVKIPMLGKLDLRRLISNAAIRFVTYELPSRTLGTSDRHCSRDLTYVFNLQIESVLPIVMEEISFVSDDEEEDEEEDEDAYEVSVVKSHDVPLSDTKVSLAKQAIPKTTSKVKQWIQKLKAFGSSSRLCLKIISLLNQLSS